MFYLILFLKPFLIIGSEINPDLSINQTIIFLFGAIILVILILFIIILLSLISRINKIEYKVLFLYQLYGKMLNELIQFQKLVDALQIFTKEFQNFFDFYSKVIQELTGKFKRSKKPEHPES